MVTFENEKLSMTRKLHIGGVQPAAGWEIFNAVSGPHVDHVGNAKDLSRFKDNTFQVIYASHVLEHFDYKTELEIALQEWKRVLIPKGLLYVSVPDLDSLAWLLLQKDKLCTDERFFVMRMIFGGHMDQHDYHHVGLNGEFLTAYLKKAGFHNIRRVDSFGLFDDTSNMHFKNVRISVNVIAEKSIDLKQ